MSLRSRLLSIFTTANMSFQEKGISKAEKVSSPLHHIFKAHDLMDDLVKRGAAFGLFTKEAEVVLDIPLLAIQGKNMVTYDTPRYFDCVILEMEADKKEHHITEDEKFLHIYKDKETGFYFIGHIKDDVLQLDDDSQEALKDNQLYFKTFEWCRDYATNHPSKRMPLHDVISGKTMTQDFLPLRVGKALASDFIRSLNRSLG